MRKIFLGGIICAGLFILGIRYFCRRKPNRYFHWYKTLYQWLLVRQDKVEIADYFKENGYQRVAIYGMGELGRLLLKELRDTGIEIPYVID